MNAAEYSCVSVSTSRYCKNRCFSTTYFFVVRNVPDVPQPPEGPLQPTDVTKNSCVLRWNPPKDDGGSEITHYVVEKMDADTSRWVPVGDPMGTSLRYAVVNDNNNRTRYTYV